MGQSLEVVTSELRSASAKLAEAGQRLQDGLSAVDLSVDQLLGSGWKGGAASTYSEQWNNWHNGAGQVIRGLQSMSESLKASADSYRATDQQAAGDVGSSFQPGSGSPAGPTGASSASAVSNASAPSASSAQVGGGTDVLAAMMGLGEPVAQTGGQLVEGATQAAGQLAGGLAQAAAGIAQGVTGIVEAAQSQSGSAVSPDEFGAMADAEQSAGQSAGQHEDSRGHEERQQDGEKDDSEHDEGDVGQSGAAADSSGLSAPVEMTPPSPSPSLSPPTTGNPMRFGRLTDAQ